MKRALPATRVRIRTPVRPVPAARCARARPGRGGRALAQTTSRPAPRAPARSSRASRPRGQHHVGGRGAGRHPARTPPHQVAADGPHREDRHHAQAEHTGRPPRVRPGRTGAPVDGAELGDRPRCASVGGTPPRGRHGVVQSRRGPRSACRLEPGRPGQCAASTRMCSSTITSSPRPWHHTATDSRRSTSGRTLVSPSRVRGRAPGNPVRRRPGSATGPDTSPAAATSSACRPRWITRPPSSTTISSNSSSPLSRWLTSTTECPARLAARAAASTASAAAGSRPSVGSSSTSTWRRGQQGPGQRQPLPLAAG